MSKSVDIGHPTSGARPERADREGHRAGNSWAAVPGETFGAAVASSGRERLLRLPEVKARTGLSRSSIYAKVAAGRFPPQKKLGAKMVGWYQSQIDAWIADPC